MLNWGGGCGGWGAESSGKVVARCWIWMCLRWCGRGCFGGIEGWRFRVRTRRPVAAATGLLISEPLLFFEAAVAELQCPAVLGDDAHHSVRRAVGYVGLDLKGQRHIGAGQAGQV